MRQYLTLLLILSLCPLPGLAYNRSYEQRISKQLSNGPLAEEIVLLGSGDEEFVSLYRNFSSPQARGAVIILHGMGGHADWPEVIGPLRKALPAAGWATLSLQMPVLSPAESAADYGKTLKQANQRIRLAVQQLRAWDFEHIVLLGYSFGAATAAQALSVDKPEDVSAFVGISMQAQQFLSPRLKLFKHLQALQLPVLDIYGSRDMLKVRREADDRRLAAGKGENAAYQQLSIDGADHYYTGLQDVLIKRIQGWLAKTLPPPAAAALVDAAETKVEARSGE